MPGSVLSAISARDTAKAKQEMRSFAQHVPILPLKELAEVADIVVDAAPADALRAMASPLCAPAASLLLSALVRFYSPAISSNLRANIKRKSSCRAARLWD